jgi:hypothetical protein
MPVRRIPKRRSLTVTRQVDGGKALLLVKPPVSADPTGCLAISVETYRQAFSALGYAVHVLDPDSWSAAQIRQLLTIRFAVILSDGGWAYQINVIDAKGRLRPLTEIFDAPTIALICDPPYSPWMDPIVTAQADNRANFYLDLDFLSFLRTRVPIKGGHFPYIPPCTFAPPAPPTRLHDRPIRFLFAGFFRDPELYRRACFDEFPAGKSLFDAIVERAIPDLRSPFAGIVASACQDSGCRLDLKTASSRRLVHYADQFIRNRRREAMLRALASLPIHLIGQPGSLPLHPGTVCIPRLPYQDLLDCYERTQIVLICQPNYAGGVNERLIHAMQRGAAVVSTTNKRTESLFAPAHHYVPLDHDSSHLADKLDDLLCNASGMEAMAEAARAKVSTELSAVAVADFVLTRALPLGRTRVPMPDRPQRIARSLHR